MLTQTCTIKSVTTSATGLGGLRKLFNSNRVTSARCLLNQRSTRGGESESFNKVTTFDENWLYMQAITSATSIIPSDRATIGSRTFEITTKPYDVANRGVLLKMGVVEID